MPKFPPRLWIRAAAMNSLVAVPMFAEIASNPRVPGIATATALVEVFLLACYVVLVVLLVTQDKAPWLGKLAATTVLVSLAVLFGPNSLQFLGEQLRTALILAHLLPIYRTAVLTIGTLIVAAVLVGALSSRQMRYTLLSTAVTVAALLTLVMAVQTGVHAGWVAMQGTSQRALEPPPTQHAAVTHVVWIIFDELDEDVLEASLDRLPAFREFRQSAVAATNAFPPANFTHQSVPRMLVGRELMSAEFNQTRVNLRNDLDSYWVSMQQDPNFILERLASEGRRVGVAGWHFPYCTLVPHATQCVDDQRFEVPGAEITPWAWLWAKNVYVQWLEDRWVKRSGRPLQEIQLGGFQQARLLKVRTNARSLDLLGHTTLQNIDTVDDLVYAHLPCPHLPRLDGRPTSGEQALLEAYQSNLSICDQWLGDIVTKVRAANRPIAMILTSDHWLRNRDCIEQRKLGCIATVRRRVPLMVRIYGNGESSTAISYSRTISNLETGKLVSGFIEGRLQNLNDVVQALDRFGDHPTLIEPY